MKCLTSVFSFEPSSPSQPAHISLSATPEKSPTSTKPPPAKEAPDPQQQQPSEDSKSAKAAGAKKDTATPASQSVTTRPSSTLTSDQSKPGEPQPAQDAREPSAAPSTDTKLAAAVSYSMNLPSSEVDEELRKRKARAERFGMSQDTAITAVAQTANGEVKQTTVADADALKALERAKRFGASTEDTGIAKLDQALSQEAGKKRGRGAGDADSFDDPGLRMRGGKRRFRGTGRRGAGPARREIGARPTGVTKQSAAFSTEQDRHAAEARKKRWGGP